MLSYHDIDDQHNATVSTGSKHEKVSRTLLYLQPSFFQIVG